jgi:hypothetical protein
MTREKGLVIRDEAKKYVQSYGEYDEISPSLVKIKEELYGEKVLASPNVRAAAAAEITKYQLPIQEFIIGTTTTPMKYQKVSLKELVLKSNDPSLRPYQQLIKLMGLGDAKIRDLLQRTSSETINKVLFLYERTGRIFEEFLFVDLNSTQIQLLDNITKYYRLLEDEVVLQCLEKRKEFPPLQYDLEIDREKFTAKLWAFLDTDLLPLDLYMGRFGEYGEPQIGSLYSSWPCYTSLQEKIEKEYWEILPSLTFEEAVSKINQLKEKYDVLQEYKNELVKFEVSHWVYFPPRFAKKNGPLGSYLYVNKIPRPFPCPFCGRSHVYHFIAEAKKK